MKLNCLLGIHSWKGCKCLNCSATRNVEHDWSTDCEQCSVCGAKAREVVTNCPGCGKEISTWTSQPFCRTCKKFIFHDGSANCEVCSKCGKNLNESHSWNQNCEKCSKCGLTRREQHQWEKCKCTQCGSIRDVYHDWSANCEHCSNCKSVRPNSHLFKYLNNCSYECSLCNFKNSTHFFGKCNCPNYYFTKSLGQGITEQKDIRLIKELLESLQILKHNRETEYLQFYTSDIPNFPLLMHIRYLPSASISQYSIQFSLKNFLASTRMEETKSDSKNPLLLNLIIKRLSKDTFLLMKA